MFDGAGEGSFEGNGDGRIVGAGVGCCVGDGVGGKVGTGEGINVGDGVGAGVGNIDMVGKGIGRELGPGVGNEVGTGDGNIWCKPIKYTAPALLPPSSSMNAPTAISTTPSPSRSPRDTTERPKKSKELSVKNDEKPPYQLEIFCAPLT
jgi:hypothetical protein